MSTADAVQAGAILWLLVLLEGVRRLGPDDVVLCRTLGSRWRVASPARLGRGFHVVSWLVSLDVPLVLPPAPAVSGGAADVERALETMRARADRTRALMRALQVGGTLAAALLMVGVPYLAWRNGAFGFAAGMTLLLVSCVAQATLARRALLRAGALRPAFLRWMSPFAAPRAAAAVQEQLVAGLPRVVAMRELLGDEALLEAHRPALYDLAHGTAHDGAGEVAALLGVERVRSFLAAVPDVSRGEAACARCAARYRVETVQCAACDIPLVKVPWEDAARA